MFTRDVGSTEWGFLRLGGGESQIPRFRFATPLSWRLLCRRSTSPFAGPIARRWPTWCAFTAYGSCRRPWTSQGRSPRPTPWPPSPPPSAGPTPPIGGSATRPPTGPREKTSSRSGRATGSPPPWPRRCGQRGNGSELPERRRGRDRAGAGRPAGERRLHRADHPAVPDLGGADLLSPADPRRTRGARRGLPARRGARPRVGQLRPLDQLRAAADRRLPDRDRHHPGRRESRRERSAAHRNQPGRGRLPAGQPGRPAPLHDRGPDVAQDPPPPDPGQSPCPSGGGQGPGVDLNRNYDFLWDYPVAFSPQAPVATSTQPCDEVYRGPSAVSEPETANITWLLDQHPSVTHFIDVHSFGELILYNWGDDDDQTTEPSMNFYNPDYDGKRGIPDSTPGGDPEKYREYLPADDLGEAIALGTTMRNAIQAAHGRSYSVQNAVGLYPTSGTSDDWAYSRDFLDSTTGKVLGFTLEWGPQRASIPKSFHPDYSDMVPIIEEVTAALLAFCSAVAGRGADLQDTGQTAAIPG